MTVLLKPRRSPAAGLANQPLHAVARASRQGPRVDAGTGIALVGDVLAWSTSPLCSTSSNPYCTRVPAYIGAQWQHRSPPRLARLLALCTPSSHPHITPARMRRATPRHATPSFLLAA